MNHLYASIGRNTKACYTHIHDEIVILSPTDDNLYHFNGSAVDLWLFLETPKTVLELAQMLAEKYSGPSDAYQQDVMEWITDTLQRGLLIANEF